MVFLLAGLLSLFHTTAGNLLLNNRKLSSLRNVVGRLTGRDVRDQLCDLFAFVANWTCRVLLAAHRWSGTKSSGIRDVICQTSALARSSLKPPALQLSITLCVERSTRSRRHAQP